MKLQNSNNQMGQNCCSAYSLTDDPFLQMQLLYCNQEIAPLRKVVNQTIGNDVNNVYKFGNWDASYGMTGLGIIYLPREYYYDGGVRKGKPHGTGRIAWTNQDLYNGDISEGNASGHGKYQSVRKGIKYIGNWIDGHPSNGVLQYNGTQSQVYFKKDKFLTIKLKDGVIYSGDIIKRNNQYVIQGNGRMSFPDGSYYQGHFKEGHMHGRGQFFWKSGKKYKGDYHIGKKEGFGTFHYNLNRWYQGMWEDGKQHGDGSVFQKGQKIYSGKWNKGKPEGIKADR